MLICCHLIYSLLVVLAVFLFTDNLFECALEQLLNVPRFYIERVKVNAKHSEASKSPRFHCSSASGMKSAAAFVYANE